MAESFAFAIAESVLGKLGSTLIQEVGLAWGVKTELGELKDTLSTIHALLLDAEEKQATNLQISDWLGKLKLVLYDAEDVLDEFDYEALRQQVVASGSSIRSKVRSFVSSPNSLAFRLKMGHRVKNIRERLDKIAADKSKFNLTEGIANTRVVQRERQRETHSFVRASDVIGRDDDKENIVGLLKQSSDTENVSVIPIVGIGGLGKTTLAKLVYNDDRVVGHFSIKMWVCVSDEFDVKKLVKEILKEIKGDENYSDFSLQQLQSPLRNALDGEKFLLVLDDVWNTDREKWLELKDLLMDGAIGSKILVTTRKKAVASIMGTFPMQELRGLSLEDCSSLFVKCAFKDGEDEQHPNLLKIGDQIIEKCAGVPLAVRSLGSLLYSKRDERDWVSIKESGIWKLEQDENRIIAALKLSYYDLPHHLRQCFALCSIFPKDFEFSNLDLISIWMAQGLIQSSGQNARMEDIGESYINELLSRSLFQDVKQKVSGVTYTFYFLKMHDLVHDLAIFFAQPESLTLNFHNKDIPKRVQHVAFSDNDWPEEESEALRFLEKLNNIRTINFQMENVAPRSNSFVTACVLRFKCIRVLDLTESSFEVLPNSIDSLKHLRFLSLRDNKRIKKLPNSICKLYHLQTLILVDCSELEELPKSIGSMISLRILLLTMKQRDLFRKKKELRCLNSLQHLRLVNCLNLEVLFRGMESRFALRILVICNCPSLVSLSRSIKFLNALEHLVIYGCEKLEFMDGEAKEQEDIESFGSLQILQFQDLPRLEALPRWLLHGPTSNTLHHLMISSCSNLKALPTDGMQKLTSLKKLEIHDCPELINRCRPKTGDDWHKIAHVSEIYFDGQAITSSTNN
ncbi:putative disease resistance protein RGA3 [Vitis riparia]|uniref:putative disease resistance protein RGA3 n=1 Tax=Vitis riparia TaxID=96939 RepID=UPI00155A389D|nr:putative disease resistance protein RGA3 [Vitis riparia]XP_034712125.1 putative disease resistance protein RGA3 [Vitis riparia]